MIPLRDNVPRRGLPIANLALIGINATVFMLELRQGRSLERFIRRYALVPSVWSHSGAGLEGRLAPLVTSMFLHGGWMHIVSNMWCLYIFGNSLEGTVGHLRYLALYLVTGLCAGLLQLFISWGSPVPTIGASGAIAGVMGAYFLLFPRAKIATVVPIFFFPTVVDISAFVFLALWFWSQLYSGIFTLGAAFGGVAWWAHIGGFAAGVYWIRNLRPRRG